MEYSKRFANMAGAARSIDASLMPDAFDDNIYFQDIFSINNTVLLYARNLAKVDIAISQVFTEFTPQFLISLLNTPLSSIEKVVNNSALMFTLRKKDDATLRSFFNSSSIQAKKIKSNQKSLLFLLREAARNDIASAQVMSGISVDELIIIANQSSMEISQTIAENDFVFQYRGCENALKQSFLMPDSTNAKMIAMAKLLLNHAEN